MEGKIKFMTPNEFRSDNQSASTLSKSKVNKGILEVQNLSAWYGKTLAIKNISMSIQTQAITAIIGPSGCGKSTFIRCLTNGLIIV